MAYNEELSDRVRTLIALSHTDVEEKKMFGGLCFMVNGKMCVGINKNDMMVRLNPDIYDEVIHLEGVRPMDFTGRVMIGYVFVDIEALSTKSKLKYWIDLALEYNSIAKSAKKRK